MKKTHVLPHDHTNPYQGGRLDGAALTGIGILTDTVDTGGTSSVTGDFLTTTRGGGDVISTVAASGSTETIDIATGNVQDITLTADCTFTFTSPDADKARSFTLFLRQDGTGGWDTTWPGSVVWAGGVAPTLTLTASAVDVLTFVTLDGGIVWYGFATGSTVGALDDLSDVTITAPASGDVLTYDGAAWVNEAPASPSGNGVGPILITDTPAGSPLIFGDLLQTDEGDDLLYVDI